ncbi:MAG: protein kinase [Muribaculaceae bacterium]|nr:protein kinase [Alistipes senegalensis]MCM1474032.1 protein kinase [Muribaculaceae bacterium]
MGKLFGYIKQPLFEKWYITKQIGSGTYSEVYEIKSGNETAVIKVKPVFAENMESLKRKITVAEREAVIMDSLKECPYIVQYQGKTIQKISDLKYLFIIKMEKLKPFTKQENIFMPEERVMKIALDIARALECVHNSGVVHCDVKPDNFFISRDEIYKLGDFNISDYQGLERSISGSHGYTAPEVYTCNTYDLRSDIYSYGVSINQLIKWKYSPEFEKIILKACFPDVKTRYQSVSEIISDISAIKRNNNINPSEFLVKK